MLAYNQTLFVNRGSAHDIAMLIKSGIDACTKKNADENRLFISEARADQGPAMKRRWLHARGQSTQIKKEYCHIIISIVEKDIHSSKIKHPLLSANISNAKHINGSKDTLAQTVNITSKISSKNKE